MQIEYRNADAFELAELAAMLNRCFEGYLFPAHFDRQTLAKMIRVDSVDLSASGAVQREGQTIGVGLVARRGWNCRLAAMAIDPEARGQRVGTDLTQYLLRIARERGDRSFALEVIEQNAPALRLYEAAGFSPVRRLMGYHADSIDPQEDSALKEIDSAEASVAVSRWGVESLPWQIAPLTLTTLGPPHCAFQLGPATALMSNPAGEIITLSALVVETARRRQGWATRLLRALSARFPEKNWRLPILIPEEIPEAFFTRLGFCKESLTQMQMTHCL